MRAVAVICAASLLTAAPALAADKDAIEIDRNNTALADNSSRDPVFGAGIGVNLGEHLNLRAEYEVVGIDGLEDPNAVWVTAAWRF